MPTARKGQSRKTLKLFHIGSLITCTLGRSKVEECLGYLWAPEGHDGVYDPTYGKVNVSREDANTHNAELSKALVNGLDTCAIGQWGSFYFNDDKKAVNTFTGEVVAHRDNVSIKAVPGKLGKFIITFAYNGRVFRGEWSRNSDLFHFERIS